LKYRWIKTFGYLRASTLRVPNLAKEGFQKAHRGAVAKGDSLSPKTLLQ